MSVNSLIARGPLGASQAELVLDLAGYGTVAIQITGTFSGAVSFQGTVDGTWVALNATPINGTTAVTSATSPGLWVAGVAGLRSVRALMSSYASGSANLSIQTVATGGGGGAGGGGGGGGAVTIADGADVAEGTTTDPAATDSTSPWTVISLLKGLWALFDAFSGGGAVTIADGADVAEGATTDAKVTGDNAGTVSAKLRGLNYFLALVTDTVNSWFKVSVRDIQAGTAIIGQVGIDQTTPGTTNGVVVNSSALPTGASTLAEQQSQTSVLGATTGSAVITDANGTIQQYLRGIVKLAITAGGWLVNVAQINGVTPLMGSGNTGTGSLRVTVATDQPKFSVTSNYPERAFQGSATTVINTGTDIAAGNFSGAPAATFDNTTDSAVPYARYCLAMAEFPDWAAAPVAGTTVDLYALLLNVDGTDDETDAPSGTASGGAHYCGSWVIAAADALQRRQILIDWNQVGAFPLQCDFYIQNKTAQNMNNDGGTNCVVKIIPLAYGQVV